MSSERLRELQVRRAHLLALAARQRLEIARSLEAWEGPMVLINRGIIVWKFLRSRPLLLAAGAALLVMLKRRRAMTWLSSAVALWRLYRVARLRLAGH
jgi:hypothetical protein